MVVPVPHRADAGPNQERRVCMACDIEEKDPQARFCMSCGSLLTRTGSWGLSPLGQVLAGRYRVFDHLASTKMSELYLAWDLEGCRQVVLKTLHSRQRENHSHVQRFWREVRAQWKLDHPLIAQIFDVGYLEDDSPYMAMELVRGLALDELVDHRGIFSEREAIEIVLQACDSLGHVHGMGLIHRDVKPDNMIASRSVSGTWRIKLIDFGVVLDNHGQRLTQDGFVVGTPDYMSPEQIQGMDVDPRADVYALGAVLVVLLTGRPPFDGENHFQVVTSHLVDPPPSVRERRPDLSPWIDAVIRRAMAKDPRDRFDSMEALSAALNEAIENLKSAA